MKTKINLFSLIFAFIGLISCNTNQPTQSSNLEIVMFKVVILYPNGEDKTFDMDYYEKKAHANGGGFFRRKF